MRIEDWPDFVARSVMLDVSRDRVPTMARLHETIDLLASFKVNQLQLYMEHTFAYVGHEEVWRKASPLTAEENRLLDQYCAERFIELVPNQNSFGHMQRWLRHERYRPLAECPDRIDPAIAMTEPMENRCFCAVDPAVPRLLEELYTELLPNFSSPQFNVGLDETFELGQGRSAAACKEHGAGRVYLEFLKEVYQRVRAHGCTMQFWADIILNHPELIEELPGDGITAMVWGYEAGHPFDDHCARLREAGVPFYVCPGTSSWNSLIGRFPNALQNLAEAARHGCNHGAVGYLITDWGTMDTGSILHFHGRVSFAGRRWPGASRATRIWIWRRHWIVTCSEIAPAGSGCC